MGELERIVTHLNRNTGHKVLAIKQIHANHMYIGQKQYNIFFEHEGSTHNYVMPQNICDAICYEGAGNIWKIVSAIDDWLEEIKRAKEKKCEEMRATSCKRRTRKELNKIKVRGYYENM